MQEMGSILDKNIVLALNSHWVAIGTETVRKAIEDLTSESSFGDPPKLGLDVELADDAQTILGIRPVTWEEWITLPVRSYDFGINIKNGVIRAPTVIISRRYDKIPFRAPHLTANAIFERDGYRCQYCSRVMPRSKLNMDHIIPQSHGGKTTWSNVVCSCMECNTKKADRTPNEAGMLLIRPPKTPRAKPINFSIKEARHPTWAPFLHSI